MTNSTNDARYADLTERARAIMADPAATLKSLTAIADALDEFWTSVSMVDLDAGGKYRSEMDSLKDELHRRIMTLRTATLGGN